MSGNYGWLDAWRAPVKTEGYGDSHTPLNDNDNQFNIRCIMRYKLLIYNDILNFRKSVTVPIFILS